jgi:AcrR family transcriptional regulator
MSDGATAGRRERKKAATRDSIAKAAHALFLARGFDAVTVREIADHADVSPTTVFAHFPHKESLLFVEEDEQRERLIAAVRARPATSSISKSLEAFFRSQYVAMWTGETGKLRQSVMPEIAANPSLQDYAARMWVRFEDALSSAISEELGIAQPSDEIRAYSRFVLQLQLLMTSETDPILEAGFRIIDLGWEEYLGDVRRGE